MHILQLSNKKIVKCLHLFVMQAFDDFNTKALEACKTCGRTFLPRALEVHSRSKCKPRPEPSSNGNGGSGTRNNYTR